MRTLSLTVSLAVALFSVPPAARAFEPELLKDNLKKTLGFDPRFDVKVASFSTPSGFKGIDSVNVTIQGSPYSILYSNDGTKYIFGGMIGDIGVDPDKSRQAAINLKGAHAQGSEKAPITIVEYSDLQCSHCKAAHDTLEKQLYKAYTKDQVRLVFKHFPLNMHAWSEPAAVASECAAEQKEAAFWQMNDFFFSNQNSISTATIRAQALGQAKKLNLDTASFERCLAAGAALDRVAADKREGMTIGVNSTPALFINGRSMRGFRDFEEVKAVIADKQKELKK